jgi:A/G-specific adenine glycosylase
MTPARAAKSLTQSDRAITRSHDHPITQTPDHTITRKLLAWYRRQKRQLPWRGTRDPYRIWVSEVMLQQTTVGVVRERYEPFLRRFPDLHALGRAREESVLAAWSGLGYYARARNLWRAARAVCRRHGGRLPRRAAELARLPGFGPYTAAAVASLAFGERLPAADTNVTRVLSRIFAIPGKAGTGRHRARVESCAWKLLPRRRPADVTAALMDLGQTICTPRRPECPRCPLAQDCRGFQAGDPERYAPHRPRPEPERVWVAAAVGRRDGRALLARGEREFLRGLWLFPQAEAASPRAARHRLAARLGELGLRLDAGARPAHARHTVVGRRLWIEVFAASPKSSSKVRNSKLFRWFRPRELARAAIPTLTRKIASASGFLSQP